jgi:uncharacterized RmlC-like cupin family protein
MRVQVISTVAFLVKRAEQSSVRFAKGACFQASGINRRIHARIIAGVTNIDHQLSGVQLGVFIASHVMELQVPRRHADEQAGFLRHLDGDLQIVLRPAADSQIRGAVGSLKLNAHVAGVVGVAPCNAHDDFVVRPADDVEAAGLGVHPQFPPGIKIRRKWMILDVFDVEFGLRRARRDRQREGRSEQKRSTHGHTSEAYGLSYEVSAQNVSFRTKQILILSLEVGSQRISMPADEVDKCAPPMRRCCCGDQEARIMGDSDPPAEPDWKVHGLRIVRGGQLDTNTPQTPGMTRAEAISHAKVGAQKLWAGTVIVHPNAKTGPHHHGELETVIYVVRGRARFRWGNKLEFVDEAGPGDFVYVPPYVPHQELNARRDEPVEAVIVRSGQEAIVVNLDIASPEEGLNPTEADPFHSASGKQ